MPLGDLKSLAFWLKSCENVPRLWIEIGVSALNCPSSDSLKCLLTELEKKRARKVCGISMRPCLDVEDGETLRFIPECCGLRQKEHIGLCQVAPIGGGCATWGAVRDGSYLTWAACWGVMLGTEALRSHLLSLHCFLNRWEERLRRGRGFSMPSSAQAPCLPLCCPPWRPSHHYSPLTLPE